MQLEFLVKQQHIVRLDKQIVVADSKNYLTAHFVFTDDWTDIKTAIFKNGHKTYTVALENDICLVPWEVISEGTILVSVFCDDLITADVVEVDVKKSGYEEGKTPEPASKSIYTWIVEKIKELENSEISEDKLKKIIDEYFEEHPIDAVSEDEMVDYVTAFFNSHKDELKGDKGEQGPKGDKGDKGDKGEDGGIPYEETYIADANKWLTTGYTKTSKSLPTNNLPSEVENTNSMWGVLFFVCENDEYGTGTQMFFPVSGTYGGQIYVRSITDGKKNRPVISAWRKLASV